MHGSSSATTPTSLPRGKSLGLRHAIALCVGLIIGVGIFRSPSLVAANAGSESVYMLLWLAGGMLSLAGALCYAELAAAWPGPGGDFAYLRRAFGPRVGFIYAWSRLAVIQTGSVALLAFVAGDYVASLLGLGPGGSTAIAAATVALLTALNWLGTRLGTGTQLWLTLLEVGGVLVVALTAFLFLAPEVAPVAASTASSGSIGLAMVFVLLAFGGWSETVYVSAEIEDGRRRIVVALVAGLTIVTLLYLAAAFAFLQALGLDGVANSEAVAADVMARAFGLPGAAVMAGIVTIAAVTSANATIITGARSAQALGATTPMLAWLGRWDGVRRTPANALLVQGAVALVLVLIAGRSRDGFAAAVEFTAPVFWLFMLAVGIALFVLRAREPGVRRPFRVPLYPFTPAIFCVTSAYLLWSSIAYAGSAALGGVALLAVGALLSAVIRLSPQPVEEPEP